MSESSTDRPDAKDPKGGADHGPGDDRFDLPAYLARIGMPAAPATDAGGLAALHWAHLTAIPFENLDITMGRGIRVGPADIWQKLVVDRRGGYCFECNGLLQRGLAAAGFTVRAALGRVIMGRTEVPGRTHQVVLADAGGRRWLVDTGFGGLTPRAPIPLEEGATLRWGQATWRLDRDAAHGWRLSRRRGGDGGDRDGDGDGDGDGDRDPDTTAPLVLYVFDEQPVYPADIALGNHFTATSDGSSFTRRLTIARHDAAGRLTLAGRTVTRTTVDGADAIVLEDAAALLETIEGRFGLELQATAEERARLWAMALAEEATAVVPPDA